MKPEEITNLVSNFKGKIRKSHSLAEDTEEFIEDLESVLFGESEEEEDAAEAFLAEQQEVDNKIEELCSACNEIFGKEIDRELKPSEKLAEVIEVLDARNYTPEEIHDTRVEMTRIIERLIAHEPDATLRAKLRDLIETVRMHSGQIEPDSILVQLQI